MTKYGQLLQHPLWQRKRLEVMQRDRFRCVACGCDSKTLHVHHISYSGNPWESSMDDMQTLCDRCHSMMPKHPLGGVFYERDQYNEYGDILHLGFRHCLVCGNDKPACHSGVVIFGCGHSIDCMPEGFKYEWAGVQGQTKSGHESQWFHFEEGGNS